jgi:high-affinity K+ transport system ATPase subunit B
MAAGTRAAGKHCGAGDVDTLLLEKTGTITLGNRQATKFLPLRGVSQQQLADAVQLASLADETPEGHSIVVFAKRRKANASSLVQRTTLGSGANKVIQEQNNIKAPAFIHEWSPRHSCRCAPIESNHTVSAQRRTSYRRWEA